MVMTGPYTKVLACVPVINSLSACCWMKWADCCVVFASGVLPEFGRDVVSEGNRSLLTGAPEHHGSSQQHQPITALGWHPPLRSICIRSHEHLTKRAEDPALGENWRSCVLSAYDQLCWFSFAFFLWPNMKVDIANENNRRSWFSSFDPACGLWELIGRFWPCFWHLSDWKRCLV